MSISNLFDQDAGSIMAGNGYFSDYSDRWQYLLESYVGGEAYRDGAHLQRYQLETASEYQARLNSAHLDNHCASVVSVYNSFLFRQKPRRDFGSIQNDPTLDSFLRDADRDGTSFDNFMKDVATWASVFGHCHVLVSKPDVGALTRADEISADARPYVSLLTPLNVLDWNYARNAVGAYRLDYFRYVEEYNGSLRVIKEWTPDEIITSVIEANANAEETMLEQTVEVNGLGYIPAVCVYNKKTSVRGIGMSDIADIADSQKFIYNMANELEQTIRLDSHPSLVCTPETIAGNGSGSIIQIPENMDPALKPYLLQYGGASGSTIMGAIQATVASIDKMANIGSIRGTEASRMSGVAQRQEFELLNARLSEKGDNLELAEEQIWKCYASYTNNEWTGEIEYADSFNIQDIDGELAQLKIASETATDPTVQRVIDTRVLEVLGVENIELSFEPHIMVSPEGNQSVGKYSSRTPSTHG